MNTVLGGRFFAPYSGLTLRRFWFYYCCYYHFAKKHKIYILNLKKDEAREPKEASKARV